MNVLGSILVILALVIGIVPQYTDCHSQGNVVTLASGATIPMKCHWTARAEIGVALPLAAVGGLMVVNRRRRRTLLVLGGLAVLLGVSALLLPTGLIGTCGNPEMSCNVLMKPTLLLAGALTIAGGLGAVVAASRQEEEPTI
jgi:hypothetical protein